MQKYILKIFLPNSTNFLFVPKFHFTVKFSVTFNVFIVQLWEYWCISVRVAGEQVILVATTVIYQLRCYWVRKMTSGRQPRFFSLPNCRCHFGILVLCIHSFSSIQTREGPCIQARTDNERTDASLM